MHFSSSEGGWWLVQVSDETGNGGNTAYTGASPLTRVTLALWYRCEKLGIDCAEKTTKSLRKPRQIRPLNR